VYEIKTFYLLLPWWLIPSGQNRQKQCEGVRFF